ncbi:hypothetical protein CLV62_1302 [Dysgonomonas alginatilytica]|uniref:Uncharacterized protein n=1 Tax=Dysgonomonas alginatilytica TaxID=1605892 RepID=A0A2V3PL33_9BACT|nr:hypothetical protein CLV62_1302 [Dysgonomonas alginatilytica]
MQYMEILNIDEGIVFHANFALPEMEIQIDTENHNVAKRKYQITTITA